ncbi:MAG: PAS domain-containing protein, partial [Deltaproteobacteria bacterium]|nr:PAS domain-containing protein [Deltaproteobacteria bacterium]
ECRVAVIDITRSKQAEELQLVNERIYRAIGEEINYGIWVCTPDGRNIYASDSFLRLVGITQQQCSDFGWGDTLHPDDAERTMSAWKECVKCECHWEIEHRFRGTDGQWHPILARGVPIRNESGAITCWAGINLDISRLRQAENEKNKSEELNRKTLQALPANIAVIDSSGRILSVNQSWIDFARVNDAAGDAGVAAGVNYLDACRRAVADNDADAERALSGIEAVLKGDVKQFAMEYPCHSPHQKQWFLMTVVSLGSHGEDGAVISHSNITERILYEKKLLSVHEDLEVGIRVRTAELINLNLQLKKEIEDRKKAEKSLLSAYAEIKQMKNRLKAENIYLQQEVAQKHNFGELIGQSSTLSDVVLRVSQVAPMNATVLLLGETGVGKGVVAR